MRTADELDRIAAVLKTDPLPKAEEEWGGAGLIVRSVAPEPVENGFYPEPMCVATPHSLELSWLIENLWAAFAQARAIVADMDAGTFGLSTMTIEERVAAHFTDAVPTAEEKPSMK